MRGGEGGGVVCAHYSYLFFLNTDRIGFTVSQKSLDPCVSQDINFVITVNY